MIIQYLQISNILSFKYYERIEDAEKITFEEGLNIIIGENGAGKSTALEIINFIFKRILFKQYFVNQDLYSNRDNVNSDQRRQILNFTNSNEYTGFRLEKNWDTEDKPRTIRITVKLDEIDKKNIEILLTNREDLFSKVGTYSNYGKTTHTSYQEIYTIDIVSNENQTFSTTLKDCSEDFGYEYLSNYNFYKETLTLYHLENPGQPISTLYESFTLISGYRNYHSFNRSISLREHHPVQQIQTIKSNDFNRSLNTVDSGEPSIFGLVRLRVAEKHFELISEKLTELECEDEANKLPFILVINEKLKIINLKCKIKLIDKRTWQYSFEFYDITRGKVITNINSLSAGQKAIIHLIFEAYGRGDLKGGVVIIDEPEIHLHYQFQNEYLQVIKSLNVEQKCQYILVTHSEALINSSTINNVKRFSLNNAGHTEIKAPRLTTDQKTLIKILDNTRSTYAFFAKKVILVEGDTDRYFFKSIIQELYPELDQSIAVLYMGGKGGYEKWKNLFKAFGLTVYFVSDFDCLIQRGYPQEKGTPLKTEIDIQAFHQKYPEWEQKINDDYSNKVFILRKGTIEHYMGVSKGLTETIAFCNTRLTTFLSCDSIDSREIKNIFEQIVNT